MKYLSDICTAHPPKHVGVTPCVQGRAGVLKRTTNEQRLTGPRPSDGWIKIGVGGITDQT
jgi:hypothetical protein